MTDRYAVIGNPVGHTKSPFIHGLFAKACAPVIEYSALEVPIGGFAGAVGAFRSEGGRGLDVTVPFKLEA